MDNPIRYRDLFDDNLQQDLNGLIEHVKSVKGELLNMVSEVKRASESVAESLSSTTSASKGGRDDTRQQSADVEKLYDAYKTLGEGIKYCTKQIDSLTKAQEKFNNIVQANDAINKAWGDAIEKVKAEMELAKAALDGMTASQKQLSAEGKQYQQLIKTLSGQVTNYTAALKGTTAAQKEANKAAKEEQTIKQTLAESYSSLDALIKETGVDINSLLTSQRQQDIATKNGAVANTALAGSYNQLYAQYNLVKNVLNAMGTEMRNDTEIGKKWEAEALRMMNVMKQMQEATGKHTLSVGDYSKALNGLQISTQQVLREMPTLANSLQQFFIAISNNVPIFVDNLKRVQKETGSWAVAMKGVMTSIFSWQTALLVLLTILPKIAKAIHDKKKAQDEDNNSTKKAITLMGLLHEAMVAVAKAEAEDAAKLTTLVHISQDYNRSQEDRIKAASVLKGVYTDQLANYSAEEIALGKAKTALDNITEALKQQAKARALLNKITEAYIGQIDAEDKAIEAGKTKIYEYGLQNVEGLYNYIQNMMQTTGMSEEHIRKSIALVEKGAKDIWKQYDIYKKAKAEIKAYGDTISNLEKRIPTGGLDFLTPDPKRGKERLDKLKDYYWDWLESEANIIQDEEDRELELNNIRYERAKANYQAILDEQKAAGTLTIEQEKYLTEIIVNLEKERQMKRQEIIWEYYEKWWNSIKDRYNMLPTEEMIDEEDMSISGRYEKVLAGLAERVLSSRERLNTALEKGSYREAKAEGKAFKDATIEKLKLEEELQEALLQMRLDTGEITADQYKIELAEMRSALAKNIASLSKTRRTGKFDLWTMFFGKVSEDGKGNIFKELDAEQKQFISSFNNAINLSLQYMDEWMDKRIEMAEVAVEAAQKETEAAKTALDYEMEARANGYANNVELARKEYEEKLALEQEAVAEKKRLEKIQEGINTATQISSLITATAELWAAHASIPFVGTALAIAATAAMWGSFAAAKIQAMSLANSKTYGEGGMEYINYGGSHASGNDVDFGRTKDGRPRRIERGEAVAVINKKNVDRYGVERIKNIIQTLNNGTFEDVYSPTSILNSKASSVVESTQGMEMADMYALAFAAMGLNGGTAADLSGVERGIQTLIDQNSVRIVPTPYGRIEYSGNNKRIIRNS